MKPEIKAKLVKALRSGKYKQAYHKLRTVDNCFCIMDVLCNLHAQAHPEIAAEQKSKTRYMGCATFPPKAVQEWAGIKKGTGPVVSINGRKLNLMEHNDRGVPFSALAAAINAQL